MAKQTNDIAELSKEDLLAQLEQSKAIIGELKAEVAKKAGLNAPLTVDVDGVTYAFAINRFTIPGAGGGTEWTAEQAAESPETLAYLIAKQSGVLVAV